MTYEIQSQLPHRDELTPRCLPWPLAAKGAAQGPQEFPLGQSTCWIYECHIHRRDAQSPAVEKSLTWRVEILETLYHGEVTVAHLEGHPEDLHQNMGKRGRQDYLIVGIGDRIFYLVGPPESLDLLIRLRKR
jgi:hypothetical protein